MVKSLSCLSLVSIKLTDCVLLTDDAIMYITTGTTGTTATTLRSIACGGSQLLTDLTVKFLSYLPLISIKLSNFELLTDEAIKYLSIGTTATTLQSIDCSLCGSLTDDAVKYISVCPIKSIDFSFCNLTNNAFKYLANSSPSSLNRSSPSSLNRSSPSSLNRSFPSSLIIESVNLSFCTSITDEAVKFISMCPNLRELILINCLLLTNNTAKYISNGAAAATIQKIDLTFCSKITDLCGSYLASCPNLKKLDLTQCKLTNKTIEYLSLGPARTSLEDLCFFKCTQMTNEAVILLLNFPMLRSVDFRGCDMVDTIFNKLPAKITWKIGKTDTWKIEKTESRIA